VCRVGEKWNHDSECLRLCQQRKSKFIEQAPARQRALDKIKSESKYLAETTAIELISIYQASSEGCKLTKRYSFILRFSFILTDSFILKVIQSEACFGFEQQCSAHSS
jgi:hypothetical protein